MFRTPSSLRGRLAGARGGRRPLAHASRSGFRLSVERLQLEALEDRRLLSAAPLGDEFTVSPIAAGAEVTPRIAHDQAGNFVVVWEDTGIDGDGYGIFAQHYQADGTPLGGRVTVNTVTAGNQRAPAVAMNNSGQYVITWQNGDIFAQRFAADGSPIDGEFTVNATTAGLQSAPDVGIDAAGNFAVAWWGHPGTGYAARQFDADGSPHDEISLAGDQSSSEPWPELAMNGAGEFAIATLLGADLVSITRYHPDGSQISDFISYRLQTGNQQLDGLDLAIDSTGNLALMYSAPSVGYTYVQRFGSTGITQFSAIDDIKSLGSRASLAMDAAGNYATGARRIGLVINQFQADGHFYDDRVTVPSPSPSGSGIALNEDGGITLVWNAGQAIKARMFQNTTPIRVGGVTTTMDEDLGANALARHPVAEILARFTSEASTDGGATDDHSVTNPANWRLYRDNIDVSDTITGIIYHNKIATIQVNQVLQPGAYELVALDTIQDTQGNPLDGDASGAAGGDSSTTFQVGELVLSGVDDVASLDKYSGGSGTVAVDADAEGNYVLAWLAVGAGNNTIKARRYDAGGSPLGDEIAVETTTFGSRLAVSLDEQGRFAVAWANNSGMYVRHYGGDDTPLDSTTSLGTASAVEPSIDSDAMGNTIVAWTDSATLKFARFDANGALQATDEIANLNEPGVPVRFAMNSSGNYAVSWKSGTALAARIYSSFGQLSSEYSSQLVNKVFSVDIDDSGNGAVVYSSSVNARLYTQRLPFVQAPPQPEILITTQQTWGGASVNLSPQGDLQVSWLDRAIYTQRVSSAGQLIGVPLMVSSTTPSTFAPGENYFATSMNAYGDSVFAWRGFAPTSPLLVQHVTLEQVPASANVVGRLLFYNQSVFDNNHPAARPDDDLAVAFDKRALLPGEVAELANYSSYTRGINGIMIDLAGRHGEISLEDFVFKVGNNNSPETWADAPLPSQITVRSIGSATERVSLVWADGIVNQWLQVTLLATPNTGLAGPDTFYFGSAAGDSGNSATDARVNIADQLGARNHATGSATIESLWDYNRDGAVDATDELWARNHATGMHNSLRLIDLSPIITVASAAPAAAASSPAVASALALSSLASRTTAAEQPAPPAVRPGEADLALSLARQAVLARPAVLPLVPADMPDRALSKAAAAFSPDDDWLSDDAP